MFIIVSHYRQFNWMAPGKNRVTAIWTFFSSMSESTQTSQADLWFEKMFLCCFSIKAGRIDLNKLTNRPKVLSPHPSPLPPHCFLPCSMGFLISRVSKLSIFQEERSNWGGGSGCVWGEGGWRERTLGLFVSLFMSILPAFMEKQHRDIFSNHRGRLAKFGWILTYLKVSVQMAVTRFLPGSIQLSAACMITLGQCEVPGNPSPSQREGGTTHSGID